MMLREAIEAAREGHYAVGHFNVSDSTQLSTIAGLAAELQKPVIIGASESERKFFGTAALAAMVDALRKGGAPIFLNADHTRDIEGIKTCIDAGFDAVLFDGSALPVEENIVKTREAVAYARASGRDIIVEGELGYIGTSSALLQNVPEGAGRDMTTPDMAARFVRETGVDLLAPSVGNIHGMLVSAPEPKLHTDLVGHIAEAAGVPLVLHGASGNTSEEVAAAIDAGVAIVHINTEIRLAYREGIQAVLVEHPDEVAPYKYLGEGAARMRAVVAEKVALFSR